MQIRSTCLALAQLVHHEACGASRASILMTSGAIRPLSTSQAFPIFKSESTVTSKTLRGLLQGVPKLAAQAAQLFGCIAGLTLSLVIDDERVCALLALI